MSRQTARAERRRQRRADQPAPRPLTRLLASPSTLVAALLVVAGLYAYHDGFRGVFLFDDLRSIPGNETIRRLSWATLQPPRRSAVSGRPIVNLSLALTYAAAGLDVAAYRAGNLVIHLLAGLVLFGLVRRTLLVPALRPRYGERATWLAASVALLWVVHPLLSESVTYVIQRTELLMGLFFLLTLYCLVRGADSPRPRGWYVAAVAAFVLGLGSKEVTLVAPVVLLAYDRTFLSESVRDALRRRGGLYASLAFVMVVLVAVTGTRVRSGLPHLLSGRVTPSDYAMTQAGVIVHYLRLALWPHPLCADYDDWPIARSLLDVLPSALVVAALLAATLWAWIRGLRVAFLGVWLFAVLAPTSSFWPLAGEVAAERRMYLPLAAVITLVVLGADAVLRALLPRAVDRPRRRLVAGVLVVATAAILAQLTVGRTADYRSPTAFWTAIVTTRPGNVRARINMGDILFKSGRTAEALEQYAEAVRLKPESAMAHYGLGVTLAQAGKIADAMMQYREALRLEPGYAEASNNLGILLARQGRPDEAVEHYLTAIRAKPDHALAHYNLARALLQLGRTGEAVDHLETTVKLRPDLAEARRTLDGARRRLAGGEDPPAPGSQE